MVHNRLASPCLQKLFNEVWASLPKRRRTALLRRCILITDSPQFLATEDHHALAALLQVSFRKSIFILYLNSLRLPAEPPAFGRALIAQELARVLRARTSSLNLAQTTVTR